MKNLSAARGSAPAVDESSAWVRRTDGQPELDFAHVPTLTLLCYISICDEEKNTKNLGI